MKFTEISLRRPITVIMLFISLSAVGIISSRLLPLEYFPEIQFPGAFIMIPYQGSTPEEVERLITRPVEEALATMSGIKRLRSESRQDQAQISAFFGWDADSAVKGMEVMDKIDSIRHLLPDDVERIFVFRGSTSDQPIMVLRLSSSSRDLEGAYDLLNRHLKRRLERIEGVSQVRLEGVEPWEIRIQLIADRIAAHNVDINALTQTLQEANFSVTAGRITDAGQRLRVHPIGEFKSIDDIGNLIVQGNLRLRDIAEITYESKERNYGRHLDRRYAIGASILKETGANMVEISKRVNAELDKITELPQMRGITVFFLDNAADGVRQSLSDVLRAGTLGALLSFFVLYLFLRQIATTLTVTLAVPFSLTIALGAMFFFNISLNILSMMGLMLAIGMLVDNAVVVTENIFRRKQLDPENPQKATILGVKEVSTAVTAGTLTTVIVFLPMIFGTKADINVFLEHVAITIIVSLIASLFISLTMIPMIASRIEVPAAASSGFMESVKSRYRRYLSWSLDHRWKIVSATFAIMVGGIGLMSSDAVKKDMFPQEASRRLFMPYHLEGTYSLERVEQTVYTIENYLYDNADEFEIRSVYSYFEPGRAESTILLKEKEDGAEKSVEEIKEAIRENLPNIVIGKPSFEFNQTGNQDGVSIMLLGDSSEELNGLSREVARILNSVEGLADVRANTAGADREVQIVVNRDRAQQYGMTVQQVAGAVAVAMRGQNLRQFRGESGEITVKLEFRDTDRQRLKDLESLPLFTASGQRITLSTVADFRITQGPARILRQNRSTGVTLTANLAD
ncbi:MAG: efflux RND transporter permease subunit, partial [Gammaproteobacteria bacterium]|nr:efflux RND transporter permease subunit [Gammaproteobacteria bacterium]